MSIYISPLLIDTNKLPDTVLFEGADISKYLTEEYLCTATKYEEHDSKQKYLLSLEYRRDIYDISGKLINLADSFMYFLAERYADTVGLSLEGGLNNEGPPFSDYILAQEVKGVLKILKKIQKIEKKYVTEIELLIILFEEAMKKGVGIICLFT